MSLEALYNQAAANTYVGTVRAKQAADAPTNQTLVNFLDGQAKGRYRAGAALTPDTFQTEFTRNAPGTYLSAGAQGIARNPGESLTRWTNKSFSIAFDNDGPSQLKNGFYTNQFRTAVGPRGAVTVHNYTPNNGKKFGDKYNSAKARIASSPSGAPTGF